MSTAVVKDPLATPDFLDISTDGSADNDESKTKSGCNNRPFSVPHVYQMHVKANISNRFAHTTIISKVENLTDTAQEAIFSVILPEDAYISGFVMEVDGKSYTAYVKEKEEAKETYTKAVARGLGAAHVAVTARDSNRFTVSVNTEPTTKAAFYLSYEELLKRQNGHYEQIINLHPGQLVGDLSVEVAITESRKIIDLKVPALRSGNEIGDEKPELNPRADVEIIAETAALVKFSPNLERQKQLALLLGKQEEQGLAGQFVLQYDVERDPQGGEVLVQDGFFVHFFAPSELTPLAKYVVFVLDTSGSMCGRKMNQLKQAMCKILEQLSENDLFHIVEFNTFTKVWNITEGSSVPIQDIQTYDGDKPHLANAATILKAKAVVSKLNPSECTDIYTALMVGLHLVATVDDSGHQPMIIFLTDGEPTVGLTSIEQIIKDVTQSNSKSRKTPIYALSFGDFADKDFLRRLSFRNVGFCKHIYEAADASLQLEDFYRQISSPLLSNVTFKYEPTVTSLTKAEFALHFRGSEIVVAGRYDTSDLGNSNVTAWNGLQLIVLVPTVIVYRTVSTIERLWAYLTVRQLLQQAEVVDEGAEELKKLALDLALKYSFVTSVSSLVVVKPDDTNSAVDTEAADKLKPVQQDALLHLGRDTRLGESRYFGAFRPTFNMTRNLFSRSKCFDGLLSGSAPEDRITFDSLSAKTQYCKSSLQSKRSKYLGVPTSVELENNSNQNKYTVNRSPDSGVTISKLCLVLMALGAILLIALAVGLTILLYPRCSNAAPEALTQMSSAPPAERLPKNLEPLHYRLQLMPFLEEGNFTTSGAVSITIDTRESTNKIVLNMFDIAVEKGSIKVKKLNTSEYIDVTDQKYNNVSEAYTIFLKDQLVKGEQYELEMKFEGKLNDKMQGFYRSNYVDPKTNTTRWMASTQFSPTDARRAFPCFDEPAFKSKFTISIARPNNMTTISNMPKRATDTIVDRANWEWDHYAETPLMSSYLVAFVASDLQAYRYNSSGKLLYTVWTRLKSVDQTRLVIDLSPRILEYFENYFQIKFPLPKIDLVAVPDFGFSAMENWGLITFKETVMLFDKKTATIEDMRRVVTVLTHELAHQWFGNLVTPKWWDDLWLKEGFANYMVYLGVQQVSPSWNLMDEFLSSEVYPAFEADYFKSSHPISFEVVSTNEIRQMFGSTSYSKGASLIRMVSHVLGEQEFKEGLIKFLNEHKYGNANHDDLWQVFQPSENRETTLKEIMDTWIKQAGFPVLTALRNHTTGQVHLSQKRFFFAKNAQDKSLWWIPISYASDTRPQFDDTKPKFWMPNAPEMTITVEADRWWLLNLQQTGYYIVNYDEQNWRTLADHVMVFPPTTRVQLISDSMDLARANLLDYDTPLKMLSNIGAHDKDISFIAHDAAFDKVSFLYEMLISTSTYKKFEDFLFAIFNHAFTTVDFNDSPSDEYIVQRIRRLIVKWACKKSVSRCTNEARTLFGKWAANPNQPLYTKIPPNVQSVVLCTAIREGGEAEWALIYNYYKTSDSIYEKNILLQSLGCSKTPWILSRYLDFMMKNDTGIRKQDSSRIFEAVADNPVGYHIAFNYLRSHWKELNEYFGPAFSTVSKMVAKLPIYMNTPFQLTELESFRNSNLNNLGTSSQAFDKTIERVKSNVEWMDHSYESIEKWLDEHARHFGI